MTAGLLEGKVAVITGSTRGLGFAIAQAYASEGAAVVVASRSVAAVEQSVSCLARDGAQASGQVCDVADLFQATALADYAVRAFGRLDIWVNNAGVVATHGPTAHIPSQEITQLIYTNILGVYHGTLAALRHFIPQRSGKLINMLGRGARQPVAFGNAYAASKAWARNFTLALAREYKDSGVGIYGFNPGLMDTDIVRNFRVIAGYEHRAKLFRVIADFWATSPEASARKAVWLASSATDGRTGLDVDMLGPTAMVSGVLRAGLRRLMRQQTPFEMQVTIVPAALDVPQASRQTPSSTVVSSEGKR